MPAYLTQLSFVVKQSLILSFWKVNQGNSYAQMTFSFCTNHSVYFCLSGFSLYILVLCGELLCPVMSHCCAFFSYVFSSFVCTSSVVLLRMCKHRLQTLWSCATSDALQLLRHVCSHCVPNKTSFMSQTLL